MKQIENIIFDLGGVLLDIDFDRTTRAFAALGAEAIDQRFNMHYSDRLFLDVETGRITNSDFLSALAAELAGPVSHDELAAAWNALLVGFRKESILHLAQLSGCYRLYLLSNTNSIHHGAFSAFFKRDTGLDRLEDCFTKAWYSHELGLRKPDADIYQAVLAEGNLHPETTLFIDDSAANIAAAAALGIQTRRLLTGERIEELGL